MGKNITVSMQNLQQKIGQTKYTIESFIGHCFTELQYTQLLLTVYHVYFIIGLWNQQ